MPFPPAKPGPVVVWQQGGPGGQMTNDFGASVESPYSMLPQFGIPVFMANAAGRTVQDAQFYSDMAEGRNFGQLDIQQIKEGVDALVAREDRGPGAGGHHRLLLRRLLHAAEHPHLPGLLRRGQRPVLAHGPVRGVHLRLHAVRQLPHGHLAHGGPERVRQGRPAVRRQGRDHAHPAVPRAAGLPAGGPAGAVPRRAGRAGTCR